MASDVFLTTQTRVNLEHLLAGSQEQAIIQLNAHMTELKRLQSQNTELFKQLDNKVVEQNNDKDHARYLNLLNINGPDLETMKLLQEQSNDWLANPLTFWNGPALNAMDTGNAPQMSSQAQIVGCYMQARSDNA